VERHNTHNKRHTNYISPWDERVFDNICQNADVFWAEQKKKWQKLKQSEGGEGAKK